MSTPSSPNETHSIVNQQEKSKKMAKRRPIKGPPPKGPTANRPREMFHGEPLPCPEHLAKPVHSAASASGPKYRRSRPCSHRILHSRHFLPVSATCSRQVMFSSQLFLGDTVFGDSMSTPCCTPWAWPGTCVHRREDVERREGNAGGWWIGICQRRWHRYR